MSNNSIKDNFRTPLTPLHRGGPRRLHKGGIKGIYSIGLEVLAFSLIELSIVLIIIGLLVAGVTGGKSLIESAKIRAFTNELENYKRAAYTSLAINGRLPGDLNNDGYSGGCYILNGGINYESNCTLETYTISSFSAPYNTASTTPNNYSAPFVDLELSGIGSYNLDKNDVKTANPKNPIHRKGLTIFRYT